MDAKRLLFPITERTFTYERYARLLDDFADLERFRVVPLRDFASTVDAARAVVGLRHDVDQRLDRALDFAGSSTITGYGARTSSSTRPPTGATLA